ncbi:MAG: adenylate kinase [Candidatus Bipolaricaulis sp.]|nr:adenylate kinase [Candidatus Bipolaricaulis sp.]
MLAEKKSVPGAPGVRISVVGTCGAGKTTLAKSLAHLLDLPYVEIDALFWRAGWGESTDAELRLAVRDGVSGAAWVIDGNYTRVRDLIEPRADTLVWLDYSLPRVFWRLLGRTLRRAVLREPLWHGNRESLRKSFLSRESILLWAVKTHRRRRAQYRALAADPQNRHLTVIRLGSPREADRWLRRIAAA